MNCYAAFRCENAPAEYVGPFSSEEEAQDYCDIQNMHLSDRGIPGWVGSWGTATCW